MADSKVYIEMPNSKNKQNNPEKVEPTYIIYYTTHQGLQ